LSIHTGLQQNVVVIAIKGRFLGAEYNRQFREIVDRRRAEGYNRFVVDFSGVEWIDSAGIGTIIAARISVGKSGGTICPANLTERVAYYFEICNLDAIFQRYDTVEEAVASFSV
jgi:anti-sigma B factor antagonist